jgi:pilus assembly protein FimV
VVAPVKPTEALPDKAVAVEKRQAGRAAGQSRLRLDPLEVLAERVTTLESAKAAASAPVPSDDVVKDAMRFQSLESDVKALLALAAKNETNLLEMKTRLQKAESERFANWLVYALAAAVVLCLGAVLTLWNRQKKLQAGKGDWWRGGDAATERVNISAAPQAAVTPVAPETTAATLDIFDRGSRAVGVGAPPPPKEHAPVSTVDLHLSEVSASTFDTLLQSGPASIRGSKPAALSRASGPGSRRINSDELFDIRQQAEFFVSLGQTDQAIRVLERHIAENAGSSPSLYLELLQLFHSLNLKTDYRQFREDFNLLFNCRIPDFAMFRQEGRGLEAYPDVLADISALWTSPQVLQLLDACIFQNAWDINGQTFDLAAFRELLLLYAVAQSEHEAPAPAGQPEFTRMPKVKQHSRSGFGGLTTDSAERVNTQFGQETSLDAYPTSSEPLPSIYGDVDIDLDIDIDSVHSTNQSKKPLA